jgi:hypothetical protein
MDVDPVSALPQVLTDLRGYFLTCMFKSVHVNLVPVHVNLVSVHLNLGPFQLNLGSLHSVVGHLNYAETVG